MPLGLDKREMPSLPPRRIVPWGQSSEATWIRATWISDAAHTYFWQPSSSSCLPSEPGTWLRWLEASYEPGEGEKRANSLLLTHSFQIKCQADRVDRSVWLQEQKHPGKITTMKSEPKEARQGSTRDPVNWCHSISLSPSMTTPLLPPNTTRLPAVLDTEKSSYWQLQ